ncbi:hypothetical protein P3339_08760 [Microbulbifer sp. MLAF003]|uniref:hypothetical protein n=1 Tax=Microbulbifer sp. MLAF003 TaxID=3032582 RepID=UPI0024AE86A9|nr:hypothetical protein [Microbulbifer sp. MLAF003]WHI52835.1 hypothetical protein P3339_08760 [Microbulbifer sp. MLAF003]
MINIHAVLDGRSIMTLFSDLDRFLRSNTNLEQVESLPLQESIASQLEASGYFGEEELEHKSKGDFSWAVEKEAAPSERKACAISYLMPPEKIDLLAQLAKKTR